MEKTTFRQLYDILSRIRKAKVGALMSSAYLTESVLGVSVKWLDENGKDLLWSTYSIPVDDIDNQETFVEDVFSNL